MIGCKLEWGLAAAQYSRKVEISIDMSQAKKIMWKTDRKRVKRKLDRERGGRRKESRKKKNVSCTEKMFFLKGSGKRKVDLRCICIKKDYIKV